MPIRKIGIVTRTYRHVNRYRQILTILIKYGFGDLVDRLRIGQYVEIGLQLLSRGPRAPVEKLSTHQRIRMVLEELGPTFIKLGQVLSTRPDLIPPDLADELARLQQHVAPFPFEQVRRIVETELGRPLEEVFERFEEQALAAASIGQVHRAVLRDGEDVVVKVQRPRIRSVIDVDLEILLHLATLIERHVEGGRLHRPTRIVEEFTRVIERELDFGIEAAHLERFAAQFINDPTIYVPKVFHDASARRVLTLEYVDGVPIGVLTGGGGDGARGDHDPRRLAERGADLTLRQIFDHGFFHADPHAGNILVLPGDVICLLDFGMMGRLDRRCREDVADLIFAVARRDAAAASRALVRVTEHDDEVDLDLRALERDVAEFIDLHVTGELGRLNMARLLRGMLDLVGRHSLRIAPDLVTMLKALATVEGIAVRLDPQLDMIARAEPYVRRLKLDRLSPRRVLREVYDSSAELIELAREIPGAVRDLLRLAKRGGLRLGFEHRGLGELIDSNERIANRVSFAIVVAALIVGSSLIVHSEIPPTWHGIPVIGLAGFLAAGVMGFLLLVAIIRHGRM